MLILLGLALYWQSGLMITEAVMAVAGLSFVVAGVATDKMRFLYAGVGLFFALGCLMYVNPIAGIPNSRTDFFIGYFLFGVAVLLCFIVWSNKLRQVKSEDDEPDVYAGEDVEPQFSYADLVSDEDRAEVADNLSELLIADKPFAQTVFLALAFYITKTKGSEATKVIAESIEEFSDAERVARELLTPLKEK